MGFLDALASLSPGITAASQGLTGALQGMQQRRKQERDDAMAMIQQMRQKRLDEQQQLMNQSLLQERKSLEAQRNQTALRNRRAFEGLREAGQVKGEYDDNEDYVAPWASYQQGVVSDAKTKKSQDRYRTNIMTLYPTSDLAKIAREDPEAASGFDWQKEWDRIKAGEQEDRRDARAAAGRAQSEANLTRSIAAAQAGREFSLENRQPPQSFVKDSSALQELSDQTRSVASGLQNAVNKKIRATGMLGGVIPIPDRVQDFFNLGGTEGKDLRDQISNLYATVAKQRGGTALTEYEISLLERYLPDTKDTTKRALQQAVNFMSTLNGIIESKKATYSQYYPQVRRANTAATPPGETPGAPAGTHAGWRKLTPQEILNYKRIGYTDAQIRQAYGPQ
ncbi:MAG TPA: hypothetical protein VKD00_06870 [Methyloceanibacter sp.]|nr:hypothetical protein [Methyloceanibacter sp.]